MGLPFQSNCGVEDRDGPWHFNQYSGIRSMLFESGTAVKTIVASSITQASPREGTLLLLRASMTKSDFEHEKNHSYKSLYISTSIYQDKKFNGSSSYTSVI